MAQQVLGIDIGGTGIKGAPVDVERGTLTADRYRVLTPKPAVPAFRGAVTIDDVVAVAPEDRHAVVLRWASSVWSAWSEQQALAREWIAEARGS